MTLVELTSKAVIVTGAANGLGRALALGFAQREARVLVADTDGDGAEATAHEIGGLGIRADLSTRDEVHRVIAAARSAFGGVDLYCSNAALSAQADLLEVSDDRWDDTWHLNVMSHIWAARQLLPAWLERGDGYFFQTVSAVALTLNHYDAPYATTKRAALAFNEYLATRYGPRGIKVSAFCPRGMLTRRLLSSLESLSPAARNAMETAVSAEQAAEIAIQGIERERFLILTEDDQIEEHRSKAADYDGWIGRRQAQALEEQASFG